MVLSFRQASDVLDEMRQDSPSQDSNLEFLHNQLRLGNGIEV